MFWETLPGIIASWGAALVALAWVGKRLWKAWKYTRQLSVSVGRLIDIGDETQWPNGAKSLPESMREIYRRQGETHDLLVEHVDVEQRRFDRHLDEWHDRPPNG